jgi:2-dehydropantoate 2-reductase
MGAGSVGCFLGGALAVAGIEVHFVARPRVLQALRESGLTISDLENRRHHLDPAAPQLHATPPAGLNPAVTLLCVKSGATAEAARQLDAALKPGSVVVSMQNGVGNVERAREAAPELQWRAGMVPFNVAELAPGHYHRGTAGGLAVEQDAALAALKPAFAAFGLHLKQRPDLRPIQWGKLLINLNNPVNALSGRPLRAELLERGYRRCFAALQTEALELLRAAGIAVAPVTPVPPERFAALLRLPTPLFRLLAARMLKIDAKARSSMADDLALGRKTEIDALCGEVVRLARREGRQAPLNARMQALVEAWSQRPQPYGPRELEEALGLR